MQVFLDNILSIKGQCYITRIPLNFCKAFNFWGKFDHIPLSAVYIVSFRDVS